ncbi:mechanosensitive ion channel family protein [uncultured Roseobacter sp.]|uniref:mechanosensitive ion channel family protein n=1 Tax=uncultured Roseobacter sp. TaxID=114847 RepID=UPI002629CC2D|nr:mechanosensitive ion channel family protein [uncultured Roseobacter sp.]
MRHAIALLLTLLTSCLVATTVQAQVALPTSSSAAETAEPVELTSPEAVREMVAQMSDDQVRQMLLERLDAVAQTEAAANAAQLTFSERLTDTWEAFYTPVLDAIGLLPTLFVKQGEAFSNFATAFGITEIFTLIGLTLIALAAGYAAERVVLAICKRRDQGLGTPDSASLRSTLGFLVRRLWREVLGLVVFYVVTRTVGQFLLTLDQIAIAAPAVLNMIMIPRFAAALSRFALAPKQPDYRLVSIDDAWAAFFHRHFVTLALVVGFGFFLMGFNIRFGVPLSETRIGFWFSLALHLYIIAIAWYGKEGLTKMMLGTDPDRTAFDAQVAHAYPIFAICASAVTWIIANIVAGYGYFGLLITAPHLKTMFWLLMTPLIDTAIRGLVRHLQPPMIGEGPIAEQAYKSNKRSLIRIGRVLALGSIVLIIANAWNINLSDVGASDGGSAIAGNIIEFIVVAAFGYVVYELVSLWINRRLTREITSEVTSDQEAGEGGGAGGSRLATVLPLVLMAAQAAIATIFGLLAVGSLGIDITPLLAGAGILGLAIGFGAQKLVTDIVSGIFFLVDDAFRVGEYVDVGGTMGSVEKISIRSMQLRHHRGNVHTIPYGSVEKVTNFSRDWVIMKLMFTVPFDTDPNRVKKIFKKIGAEMLEDPLFKDDFLEPFKSQGVFQFDDVGIVMRGKFMAKPGTQFTIRKEIYNRVRNEFKANGIEFARREVRVEIPGMEDIESLEENEKATVQAAASSAVDQHIAEQQAAAAAKK